MAEPSNSNKESSTVVNLSDINTQKETVFDVPSASVISVKKAPRYKEIIEIIYTAVTAFVIIVVVGTSLVNISLNNHIEVYITLLSTCFGVLLPHPSTRKKVSISNTA